jgi:hypothetical protein
MKTFVLVHYGFETPTPEIMEAWGLWFASIEDKIVQNVGPFGAGREITHTAAKELSRDREAITGFTIINAENMDEAEGIAKDCPSITNISVYEVMSM